MNNNELHIFGSCVSRDAVEFAQGLRVGKYLARQSAVSAVSNPPARETLDALQFKEGTHPFRRRVVEEDFRKTALSELAQQDGVLLLDLIEERVPIGVTPCGALVTYSKAASEFSNARSLIQRMIAPYSDEHRDLFRKSIPVFAERIGPRPVVIHRALYAEGDWNFERANRVLGEFYDLAAKRLKSATVIEVEPRVSSASHKWGLAPYHYIDAYYRSFVEQFSASTGINVSVKQGFTMQQAAPTIQLFGDSTMNLVAPLAISHYGNRVKNYARPGTGSTDLVNGTDGFNKPWPQTVKLQYAVVNHGLNDGFEKIGKISLDKYRSNLEILSTAPNTKVIFQTPLPSTAKGRDMTEYARVMREVAAAHGLQVIDMFVFFQQQPDWQARLSDGTHPDETGVQFMLGCMKPTLDALK
jgi:lysophospholipase L1-like esterase